MNGSHTLSATLASGLLCLCVTNAAAQTTPKSRLNGYIGGPYKVVAADFTADGHLDVVLGYRLIGIVSLEQGDGRGQFSPMVINAFADEQATIRADEGIANDESKSKTPGWSEPHVHNVAYGDVDQDGLIDLVFSVGGLGKLRPGRVIVAKNTGGGHFENAREYGVPSEAKGVRFADLNNDGRLDLLYTARGSGYDGDIKIGRLYVRRGLGGWKFGPAIEADAGKSAYAIDTADLNNDGFADIIIPNEHDATVTYFINPGPTIFEDNKSLAGRTLNPQQIPNVRSHAVNDVRAADFDGDGNQDLVTANLGTSTVSVFMGNGDGSFQKDKQLDGGKNGAYLGIGDFDSDGDIDFVITHWTEDFASVFLNKGDGTFTPRTDYKTGSGNYGVDVADLNGDGHPDVVTANYRERSMSLLFGQGDGTFAAAITEPKGLRYHGGKWVPHSP